MAWPTDDSDQSGAEDQVKSPLCPIPEPTTFVLIGTALLGLAARKARRNRQKKG